MLMLNFPLIKGINIDKAKDDAVRSKFKKPTKNKKATNMGPPFHPPSSEEDTKDFKDAHFNTKSKTKKKFTQLSEDSSDSDSSNSNSSNESSEDNE